VSLILVVKNTTGQELNDSIQSKDTTINQEASYNDVKTYYENFIIKEDFEIIDSVEHIPLSLFSIFPNWKDMSNPGGEFNAGCDDVGPKRRLKFAVKNNNLWIIGYQHGGIGHHNHVFIITIYEDNEYYILKTTVGFGTFESMNKHANEHKLAFENYYASIHCH